MTMYTYPCQRDTHNNLLLLEEVTSLLTFVFHATCVWRFADTVSTLEDIGETLI
jgi:hypothetical protein